MGLRRVGPGSSNGGGEHHLGAHRRQIAETHFGLQDYATADRMFREIESGMANTFARSDVVFADIWEPHARVLQKLGQGDESKSLRNRASKLRSGYVSPYLTVLTVDLSELTRFQR